VTTFVIDNTPVSVDLRNGDIYTPNTGSVQKVNIVVPSGNELRMNSNLTVIEDVTGADGATEITLVLSDTDEVQAFGNVFISGFEVN